MNRVIEHQLQLNASSRDRWETFAAHRARVTELLCGGAKASARLCILGAGNGNDVDYPRLVGGFAEIHLVDLDGEAQVQGLARQGLAGHPAIHLHGGIDVTGMIDRISCWGPATEIGDNDLAGCRDLPLTRVRPGLPGPFDVAASTCQLSPLIHSIVQTAGEQHPRFLEAVQAVRLGHLRLLAELVAPGGVGVLVSDVVSSDTAPALTAVSPEVLPVLLGQLIQQHNFFHGVNPAVLMSLLRSEAMQTLQVRNPKGLPPWRWDIGPRTYAVCAVRFER